MRTAQTTTWVLVLAGLAGSLLAQQPAPTSGNSFGESVEVAVASVEVYVEDKNGLPVTGLVEADFELFENGEPVPLTNFYAVSDGRRVLDEQTGVEASGEETGDRLPSSLVVYIDNANLSAFHRNRALVKVEEFLRERLKRGDRAMLVSYGGAVNLELALTDSMSDLTRTLDRQAAMTLVDLGPDARRRQGLDELLSLHFALAGGAGTEIEGTEAADAGSGGQGAASANLGDSGFGDKPCEQQLGEAARSYARVAYENVKRSVEALEQFTHTLSGLPGRKALLYVSDGLPMIPGEEAFELLSQLCGGRGVTSGIRQGVFDTTTMSLSGLDKLNSASLALEGLSFNASSLYRSLTNSANANQVTFFTLEAAGPRHGSSASAESRTMLESLQSVDTVARQNLQNSLFTMADETGGRAVLNAADLGPGLEAIASDLDTYYSLGYRPEARADRAHALEVKVRRPGARVRYRKSFTAKDSQTLFADRTLGTLMYGVEDNPLGLVLEVGNAVRLDDQLHSVPVRLRIPLGKLVLLPRDGKHHGRLTVQVAARDRQGRLAPVRSAEIPLAIPDDRLAEARTKFYLYEVKMLMRQGDHTVAVGLRDEMAQQGSFVLAPVPVGEEKSEAAARP